MMVMQEKVEKIWVVGETVLGLLIPKHLGRNGKHSFADTFSVAAD